MTQKNAEQALELREQNGGKAVNTLADQIRSMEKQYQMAMPKGAEATQLIRDALTALRTTKNLDRCEKASVLGGLMTCAQLGLRPGVLGHAWLVPFWDKKAGPKDAEGKPRGGHAAQLIIGYQGLVDLAFRSGHVASVAARTAYTGDVFEVDYGTDDHILHRPKLDGDRGAPLAYYSVVKYHGGGHAFYVMGHQEMLDYRNRHATTRNRHGEIFGPWIDHFEGMAHKTTLRQLAKWMPKSAELSNAIAADNSVRLDLDPNVPAAEAAEYVEGEVVAEAEEATE